MRVTWKKKVIKCFITYLYTTCICSKRDRCNSAWYEVSVRSQRLIMLVMMKSTRPSFLSAGKIYVFSLESFTTVMRAELLRNCYRASRMRDTTFLFSRFYKLRCRTLLFSHPFSNPNCLCIWRYGDTRRESDIMCLWFYYCNYTSINRSVVFHFPFHLNLYTLYNTYTLNLYE